MSRKTKRTSGQFKSANTTSRRDKLPPDPEQENQMRAAMAHVAIVAFRAICGVDKQDALGDLLANLMHLCDRDPGLGCFYSALVTAEDHYKAETATGAEYARL